MKEIKNYEHGFTKKTEREAIRAMAKVFFETDTINMSNLPTSDPGVAGQLWNDSGTVKVST